MTTVQLSLPPPWLANSMRRLANSAAEGTGLGDRLAPEHAIADVHLETITAGNQPITGTRRQLVAARFDQCVLPTAWATSLRRGCLTASSGVSWPSSTMRATKV